MPKSLLAYRNSNAVCKQYSSVAFTFNIYILRKCPSWIDCTETSDMYKVDRLTIKFYLFLFFFVLELHHIQPPTKQAETNKIKSKFKCGICTCKPHSFRPIIFNSWHIYIWDKKKEKHFLKNCTFHSLSAYVGLCNVLESKTKQRPWVDNLAVRPSTGSFSAVYHIHSRREILPFLVLHFGLFLSFLNWNQLLTYRYITTASHRQAKTCLN